MKTRQIYKLMMMVLLVGLFMACFTSQSVNAQSYTLWEGAWLKFSSSVSGFEYEPNPPKYIKLSGKFSGFLNILTWDAVSSSFSTRMHVLTEGGWENYDLTLYAIIGNSLDFLTYWEIEEGDFKSGDGFLFTVTGRMTGTLSKDSSSLQKATLASLGGFLIQKDTSDPSDILREAGGIKFKGSLILPATFCKGSNLGTPPCP